MDGQICLNDIFPDRIRFERKRCAATLDECIHKVGVCSETCCPNCNMSCSMRCDYSLKQEKVKVGETWVANPDYIQY